MIIVQISQIHVQAVETIELNSLPIENSNNGLTKKLLTNETIELLGPFAETNFYYELLSELSPKDYYVQFNITNSELLIEPSSLTIKIDGEPVKTVALKGSTSHEVRVELTGSALNKGVHTITASFTGHIKDGVCVSQNSTGNWMSIQIDSFLNIHSFESNSNLSLDQYPKIFTGTLQHKIQVIIPQNPSSNTLAGAHILANYISQLSDPNSVDVVYENEIRKITGNVIFVGGKNEFLSSWIKETFKQTIGQVKSDALSISLMKLKNETTSVHALVILANEPSIISDKIEILTNQQFIQQLTKDSAQITKVPSQSTNEDLDKNEITFSELGMADLLLNNVNTRTNTYFYYLPEGPFAIENPSIALHFKRTDIIESYNEISSNQPTQTTFNDEKVELIVYINDVPHAIDIQTLEEDAVGNIYANIPIDKKTLGDQYLLTVQVETKGLKTENPCLLSDQTKWLYVFDDSKIVLPKVLKENQYEMYFNHFPFPFVNESDKVLIILPDTKVEQKDLQDLLGVLTTNNKLPDFQFLSTKEVTEEQLRSSHLIFLGGPSAHQSLQTKAQDLLVKESNNVPLLDEHGFVQSEVEFYGYMQKNPWSNQSFYMVVFDHLNGSNRYYSREMLSFLRDTDQPVSIVVQTGPDKLFTNTQDVQVEIDGGKKSDNHLQQASIFTLSIGFVVMLFIMIGLIFIFSKRKKRYFK